MGILAVAILSFVLLTVSFGFFLVSLDGYDRKARKLAPKYKEYAITAFILFLLSISLIYAIFLSLP